MKKIIKINGMSCNHCKMSIEQALKNIEGIENVEVNLEDKQAIIETSKEIKNETIIDVIDEIGFEVENIK